MDALSVLELARNAITVLLSTSLPLLMVALVVGLVVSLLQALTQIQEPTLSFVPKIIAVFASLLLALPFIGSAISKFTNEIMTAIVQIP